MRRHTRGCMCCSASRALAAMWRRWGCTRGAASSRCACCAGRRCAASYRHMDTPPSVAASLVYQRYGFIPLCLLCGAQVLWLPLQSCLQPQLLWRCWSKGRPQHDFPETSILLQEQAHPLSRELSRAGLEASLESKEHMQAVTHTQSEPLGTYAAGGWRWDRPV